MSLKANSPSHPAKPIRTIGADGSAGWTGNPVRPADPAIRQGVDGLGTYAIPTGPEDAGLDTSTYTAELAERFSNTALA